MAAWELHFIMRDKAYRRFQDWKALMRAKRMIKYSWYNAAGWDLYHTDQKEEDEQLARRLKDHPKSCSCDMCCNPRHSKFTKGDEKLTMQERKFLQKNIDNWD